MTPLAVIRSYDDLADALKVTRKRAGLSQFTLEIDNDMQRHQIHKLENKKKYPGKYLAPWLRSLGVVLVLVRSHELGDIKQTDLPAHPEAYRKIRKKAGRARSYSLSRARRRAIARQGALARHRKAHKK